LGELTSPFYIKRVVGNNAIVENILLVWLNYSDRSAIIYTKINVYYEKEHMIMINYNKLMEKLKENGITTYVIRQKALIPQSTLTKLKMCSANSIEEIEKNLMEYKEKHNGKDFMFDVSTKTIEDICQLLQCQPQDLIEWKVELNPELSYENRFGKEK